jgi:hypothetical protein
MKKMQYLVILLLLCSFTVSAQSGSPDSETAAEQSNAEGRSSDSEAGAGTESAVPMKTDAGAKAGGSTVTEVPQIAILDVMSTSYEAEETRMFTDILRTEVYKLHHFRIVERGVIQQILQEQKLSMSGVMDDSKLLEIGRMLAVEKLLVCRIDEIAETTAFNMRIIDVETSLLDFTENVFIKDKNQIFDAIKDMVLKIELHYVIRGDQDNPQVRRRNQEKKWQLLGATEEQIEYLIRQNSNPQEYLDIRQYDVTFTVTDYIDILEKGIQPETIKLFFQNGIPYDQVTTAISYGIVDLKNYTGQFEPLGLTFGDYLDAYSKHIVSAEEYLEYKKGYRKNKFIGGLGGVANEFPILNSDFKFFLANVAWEYFYSDFQRGIYKYSMEVGLNLMNFFLPSPYLQVNFYAGSYPFYAKLGLGALGEVFIGGHFGALGRLGIEVDNTYEFTFLMVFTGTQPNVSYTNLDARIDDPEYSPIAFPYFGAVFVYKY